MSFAAVSAFVLQCFFNPPSGGSVAAGEVPMIKVPVPAQMVESLRAKRPPLGNSYLGESEPVREWAFANSEDPTAITVQAVRVGLADAPLSPSPYSARYGLVTRTEGGLRFENQMSGYCKLLEDGVAQ